MNDYKAWVKSIIYDYNNGDWCEKPYEEQAKQNIDRLDELTEIFKKHYEESEYYDPNIGSEYDMAYDEALGYLLDELDKNNDRVNKFEYI